MRKPFSPLCADVSEKIGQNGQIGRIGLICLADLSDPSDPSDHICIAI